MCTRPCLGVDSEDDPRSRFCDRCRGSLQGGGKTGEGGMDKGRGTKVRCYRAATCQRLQAGLHPGSHQSDFPIRSSCSSILKFLNPEAIKDGVDIYSMWGIVDAPEYHQYSVIRSTNSRTSTWNSTCRTYPSLLHLGALSRMPRMHLSWNVSWTSWPMRQGKDPCRVPFAALEKQYACSTGPGNGCRKSRLGKTDTKGKRPWHCSTLLFWILCRSSRGYIRE